MDPIDDLLNDPAIRAYLHRLVKDEGLNLIERFPREGEYSDEDLAARTGINLNTVRHTLYTLYEKRLAEYHRIKNNETGWLTYLWQLRTDHIYMRYGKTWPLSWKNSNGGKSMKKKMTSSSARTARSFLPSLRQ